MSWGKNATPRPETSFEEAMSYANLKLYEMEALGLAWPDDAPTRELKLGVILPHEHDDPIMLIDLDNVRDPKSGDIHPEAKKILDKAKAFAEISQSGQGIHVFVRATLPEGYGKYIGKMDEEVFVGDEPPQAEMYDHGRHVAMTGNKLEGTPETTPETPALVEYIVGKYEDESGRRRQVEGKDGVDVPDNDSVNRRKSTSMSSYYTIPIESFAPPRGDVMETTQGFQGAHPAHGGTSSRDSESSNYHVNTSDNVWHCFAHDSGGGPLAMVGVLEGLLSCPQCGGSNVNALEQLDDEEFARLCALARDKYGFRGKPPYRAIRGVAKEYHLTMEDEKQDILGKSAYTIGTKLFEEAY